MSQRVFRRIFLYMILLLSCPSIAGAGLDEEYAAAVADARVATTEEISRSLVAIRGPDSPNHPPLLQWKTINGKDYVLLATWGGAYIKNLGWIPGQTVALASTLNLWNSPVPQFRDFFSDNGFWPEHFDERLLRLKQLLGLPYTSDKQVLVEFWALPADIFRPSADPAITDHEAQLTFPWDTDVYSTFNATPKIEEFSDVPRDYKDWFTVRTNTVYNSTPPYPWTRLGYTYDWADDTFNHGHHGLSEFVVPGGSTIIIEQVVDTEDLDNYLTRPSEQTGTVTSTSQDAFVTGVVVSQQSIASVQQQYGISDTIQTAYDIRQFNATVFDQNAIVGFSYPVNGINATVSDLKLYKLKGDMNKPFLYSDTGQSADGAWWLIDYTGRILSPDEQMLPDQLYNVRFTIKDNGPYDLNSVPGQITDPQMLALTSDSGSSGCVFKPNAGFDMGLLLIVLLPVLLLGIRKRKTASTG